MRGMLPRRKHIKIQTAEEIFVCQFGSPLVFLVFYHLYCRNFTCTLAVLDWPVSIRGNVSLHPRLLSSHTLSKSLYQQNLWKDLYLSFSLFWLHVLITQKWQLFWVGLMPGSMSKLLELILGAGEAFETLVLWAREQSPPLCRNLVLPVIPRAPSSAMLNAAAAQGVAVHCHMGYLSPRNDQVQASHCWKVKQRMKLCFLPDNSWW